VLQKNSLEARRVKASFLLNCGFSCFLTRSRAYHIITFFATEPFVIAVASFLSSQFLIDGLLVLDIEDLL